MYQIPFCDILEIVKSADFCFKSSGLKIYGVEGDNLCVKAYQLLKEDFDLEPVKIHLHKIIPMGAGLGGGSADGTYTLLLLNKLFSLNLTQDKLRAYALKLGSDCPLFVESFPQLAKGRGELLQKIDLNLKGFYLQIINIGIHINTKEAFSELNFEAEKKSIEEIVKAPIKNWKNNLHNNFEKYAFKKHPELALLMEKMYQNGAIYASMTGSGSTLYATYSEKPRLLFEETKKNVLEKIISL